jgi:hypothetical protein
MSKPIDPERTGQGICKECGKWAKERLKGWCRPCYDRLRRKNDPFARAAVQQKALDKAPSELSQIQVRIKKLWDDGTLTTDAYAIIHKLCQEAYDLRRSETEPDLLQKYEEAMAKRELESRRMQPQADQVEVALDNIQPNPNPVEVEEISNQPQPESIEQGGAPSEGGVN